METSNKIYLNTNDNPTIKHGYDTTREWSVSFVYLVTF